MANVTKLQFKGTQGTFDLSEHKDTKDHYVVCVGEQYVASAPNKSDAALLAQASRMLATIFRLNRMLDAGIIILPADVELELQEIESDLFHEGHIAYITESNG